MLNRKFQKDNKEEALQNNSVPSPSTHVPNLLKEQTLSLSQLGTYIIYKIISGEEGACQLSNAKMAKLIGISIPSLIKEKKILRKSRKSLKGKSLLKTTKRITKFNGTAPDLVKITNIWDLNTEKNKDGSIKNIFASIPNILAYIGLDVSTLGLYVYLKLVAGEDGECYQSNATLAAALGVCTRTITKQKKELLKRRKALGGRALIKLIKRGDKSNPRKTDLITITNIWDVNYKKMTQKQTQKIGDLGYKTEGSNPVKNTLFTSVKNTLFTPPCVKNIPTKKSYIYKSYNSNGYIKKKSIQKKKVASQQNYSRKSHVGNIPTPLSTPPASSLKNIFNKNNKTDTPKSMVNNLSQKKLSKPILQSKQKRAEHVYLTEAEHGELITTIGLERTKRAYKRLSDWKLSKNERYWKNSDYKSIQRWVLKALNEDDTREKKRYGRANPETALDNVTYARRACQNWVVLAHQKGVKLRLGPNYVALNTIRGEHTIRFDEHGFKEQLDNAIAKYIRDAEYVRSVQYSSTGEAPKNALNELGLGLGVDLESASFFNNKRVKQEQQPQQYVSAYTRPSQVKPGYTATSQVKPSYAATSQSITSQEVTSQSITSHSTPTNPTSSYSKASCIGVESG